MDDSRDSLAYDGPELSTTRRIRGTCVELRGPRCLEWLLPSGDRYGATARPTRSSPTLAAPERESRGDANNRAGGQAQRVKPGSSRVPDVGRRTQVRPRPSSSRAHVSASSTQAGTGIAAIHASGRTPIHSPDERIQRCRSRPRPVGSSDRTFGNTRLANETAVWDPASTRRCDATSTVNWPVQQPTVATRPPR